MSLLVVLCLSQELFLLLLMLMALLLLWKAVLRNHNGTLRRAKGRNKYDANGCRSQCWCRLNGNADEGWLMASLEKGGKRGMKANVRQCHSLRRLIATFAPILEDKKWVAMDYNSRISYKIAIVHSLYF